MKLYQPTYVGCFLLYKICYLEQSIFIYPAKFLFMNIILNKVNSNIKVNFDGEERE